MNIATQQERILPRIATAFILSAFASLSAIAALPVAAEAQSADAATSTTAYSNYANYYANYSGAGATTSYDGSGETRAQRQARIRGYRQQSSAMQQQISALGGVAVYSVKMPVLFGVGLNNISPNFGDPRSGGRTHEGEDIMAVNGTPIVSPTAAIVLRTGVGETEGNFVYTANPGSETFVYMHLDKIGEGVVAGKTLAAGSLVGYVGNTGNASGGDSHLHFEIHDSSNNPVNPFPRLTSEFSIQEKIAALATVLSQASDSNALAQFLVTNFRSAFAAAISQNIALPQQITSALASIPASTVGAGNPIVYLPAGDLDIGSTGAAVIALQTYLIQSNVGASARALATAGATGYFGSMTKAAVLEYQMANGLSPANGYYGPATRAYAAAHPAGLASTLTGSNAVAASVSAAPVGALSLARDLKLGMSGDDIRAMQKLLNAKGFTIAASGAGSAGNETAYFGPATQAAVIRFQAAKAIVPAAGYVGSITRGVIATL